MYDKIHHKKKKKKKDIIKKLKRHVTDWEKIFANLMSYKGLVPRVF